MLLQERDLSGADEDFRHAKVVSKRPPTAEELADLRFAWLVCKPWFNRKVDFPPPVYDLARQDFCLLGGRVEYLDRRQVAALMYQRREHVINLFIWPAAENHEPRPAGSQAKPLFPISARTSRGYNLVHWTQGGMDFWAVSDLNAWELNEFVRLLQERINT